MRSTETAHHFSFLLNTSDYRILRMDEDHDRMYVGCKDYILSLDLHDINREPLIVRAEAIYYLTDSYIDKIKKSIILWSRYSPFISVSGTLCYSNRMQGSNLNSVKPKRGCGEPRGLIKERSEHSLASWAHYIDRLLSLMGLFWR